MNIQDIIHNKYETKLEKKMTRSHLNLDCNQKKKVYLLYPLLKMQ